MKKIALVGTTLLTVAALATACSASNSSKDTSTKSSTSKVTKKATTKVTIATGAVSDAKVPAEGTVYMRQLLAAPHGEQSFAVVNVLMNGDKILAATLDEFQNVDKGDDWEGVPNSDGEFADSYAKGKVLIGKRENTDSYSALMKKENGATKTWEESMTAIQNFVKGKTVAEVKAAAGEIADDGKNVTDVVSGSTFADTKGYLTAIADAAENGAVSEGIKTTSTDFTVKQVLAAPHGEKSFAVITVALDSDKVAASFTDEFQYVDAKLFGGVPNSDKTFGEGFPSGIVLGSKMANNKAYSQHMKEAAKATQTWQESANAIAKFVNGKTTAEIEAAAGKIDDEGKNVTDVVSGSTFADTKGYLTAITEAIK